MMESSRYNISSASFWMPDYASISARLEHTPIAFWLVETIEPKKVVELGAAPSVSFSAYCQAINRLNLRCTADLVEIFTDEDSKDIATKNISYSERYIAGTFRNVGTVMRQRLVDALTFFDEGSIDLLHITEFWELKNKNINIIFEAWRPKLASKAVVLIDLARKGAGRFGSADLFDALRTAHPSFEFTHGDGLGIVCPSGSVPDSLRFLFKADSEETLATRFIYESLGTSVERRWRIDALRHALAEIVDTEPRLVEERAKTLATCINEPILVDVAAKLAEFCKPSLSGRARGEQTQGDARVDLLRRALRARQDQAERVQPMLEALDARANLLRAALQGQIDLAEQARIASEVHLAELRRWGCGLSIRLGIMTKITDAEMRARAEANAQITKIERNRFLHVIERLRGRLGRGIEPSLPIVAQIDDKELALREIKNTGLFDEVFYLEANPDVQISGIDPALHFRETGWWEGRRPNPTFDPLFYLADNTDVQASGANPLIHYATDGILEGRLPSHSPTQRRWLESANKPLTKEERQMISAVLETGMFDESFYRMNNPDLVEEGIDLLVHYALEGWTEGRKPNQHFDPTFYTQTYPDVFTSGMNPLVHYAKAGILEGRRACPNLDLPALFAATREEETQRSASAIQATGLFDADFYRASYPDLASLNDAEAALHFAMLGWREGRKPNPYFDPAFYLQQNAEVALLGINPLIHYAERGIFEDRPPSAASGHQGTGNADDYTRWIEAYDTLSDADRRAMKARLLRLSYRPRISVIMPVYNPSVRSLRHAIESVRRQIYPDWELCISDDASPNPAVRDTLRAMAMFEPRIKLIERPENGHISAASNSALDVATGTFIALLDHDDVISENALFEVAVALNANRDLDLLYSDEDHIDEDGNRSSPYFKTDYNPQLMLGHNMINHLGVYRTEVVRQLGGFRLGYEGSQDYDLALRVIDSSSPARICHIPAILYHWRTSAQNSTFSEAFLERCISSGRQAIVDHLVRRGEIGNVVAHPTIPTWYRVKRPRPNPPPFVSIIVPTKDKADILASCCNGILNHTDYTNYELIVVDHQSVEADTFELFSKLREDRRVKILPYTGVFNYSAINNEAVRHAAGELLVFLNNDVEVIESEWLDEMITLACLPEVGAVGAKLLYPNGRVQHAGVILGTGGVAGHFFHMIDAGEPGDMGRAVLTSTVSAVTAACLVVRKAIFEAVGGFDAEHLAVAFNDVDLCLKIRQGGWYNVVSPHAMLYHHESLSRGTETTPAKQARFKAECDFMIEKWGDELTLDPFYNPNLNLDSADFSLAWPPRRRKPWTKVE